MVDEKIIVKTVEGLLSANTTEYEVNVKIAKGLLSVNTAENEVNVKTALTQLKYR